MKRINLPLMALAISAFGIGTTEFVIMGLLPDVARDLAVSISSAGMLIAGYALSVAIGAPIMAMMTAKLPRKKALVILMGIFVLGNALCALAPNYWLLMFARVITALCHGAFFGIGAVEAASVVPEKQRASAVAIMFSGLTLANVLGVPFGTALGQEAGWRMTFWAVTAIGVFAFIALIKLLPKKEHQEAVNIKAEIKALSNLSIWVALLTTVFFSASVFALFTYIAPILGDITHISPKAVSATLLLIGVGLTIGNIIGGKLADWKLYGSLIGMLVAMMVLEIAFYWGSSNVVGAEILLFLWGAASFAAISALQMNAINKGKAAPNLISTLNIGAFNAGNALGAWAGGLVVDSSAGLHSVPFSAAFMAVIAIIMTCIGMLLSKPKPMAVPVAV